MAAHIARSNENAEMDTEGTKSMILKDFLKENTFPECVSVTGGSYLSQDVQISAGDIIYLKCFDSGQVTLVYRDLGRSRHEIKVSTDLDQKFLVLPPKEAETGPDDRAMSAVSYPTIADLILDCPTHFEATAAYDDPYLPGMSVGPGDRFHFEEIVNDSRDGRQRLKVRDELENAIYLSSDCQGNFIPLADPKEYTLRQLVDLACVPRRLKLANPTKEKEPETSSSSNEKSPEPSSSNTFPKPSPRKMFPDSPKSNTAPPSRTSLALPLKPSLSRSSSTSSSSSCSSSPRKVELRQRQLSGATNKLPPSFTGTIEMLKPEINVLVCPFNDLETVWSIPLEANLEVRPYVQDDYEVPTRRAPKFDPPPLPLGYRPKSSADRVPTFRAPIAPANAQPLVPVPIDTFAELYFSTFPVKAKIYDIAKCDPFLQEILEDVEEVTVYRLDESRRLYVKDIKSNHVFSISKDPKINFIEYPEKFKTVSELATLPVGTKITVLEDIAGDFPKPFFLRFGDVIRIASNTPSFFKKMYSGNDCPVLKCEKIDVENEDREPVKVRLPLDMELNMIMCVNHSERRVLELRDLLSRRSKIPSRDVATLPADNQAELFRQLPVDVKILKVIKDPVVVVAPTTPIILPSSFKAMFPPSPSPQADQQSNGRRGRQCISSSSSSLCQESSPRIDLIPKNIGLPLSSGIVLALKERIDVFDLDFQASEADFIRTPLEKMSMSKFEERLQMYKVMHEDECRQEHGSMDNLPDTGDSSSNSSSLPRTGSTGALDVKKKKRLKMDKVRRLSRALNPKHWRQSRAEPEPLPHPSAMGLMALAAQPHGQQNNDYTHHEMGSENFSAHLAMGKTDVAWSDRSSCVAEVSTEEEDNPYEDVEIGPIKRSSTPAAKEPSPGPFSGPMHRSLPLSRIKGRLFKRKDTPSKYDKGDNGKSSSPRGAEGGTTFRSNRFLETEIDVRAPSKPKEKSDSLSSDDKLELSSSDEEEGFHIYDTPSPLAKDKTWRHSLGKKLQGMRPRHYDVPKSDKSADRPPVPDGHPPPTMVRSQSAEVTSKSQNDKKPEPTKASEETKQSASHPDLDLPVPPRRRRRQREKSADKNVLEDKAHKDSDESKDTYTLPVKPAKTRANNASDTKSIDQSEAVNKDKDNRQKQVPIKETLFTEKSGPAQTDKTDHTNFKTNHGKRFVDSEMRSTDRGSRDNIKTPKEVGLASKRNEESDSRNKNGDDGKNNGQSGVFMKRETPTPKPRKSQSVPLDDALSGMKDISLDNKSESNTSLDRVPRELTTGKSASLETSTSGKEAKNTAVKQSLVTSTSVNSELKSKSATSTSDKTKQNTFFTDKFSSRGLKMTFIGKRGSDDTQKPTSSPAQPLSEVPVLSKPKPPPKPKPLP